MRTTPLMPSGACETSSTDGSRIAEKKLSRIASVSLSITLSGISMLNTSGVPTGPSSRSAATESIRFFVKTSPPAHVQTEGLPGRHDSRWVQSWSCSPPAAPGSLAFASTSGVASATSRPAVPTISRRFVPGASPVVVTNTPLAPLAYSRMAVTSSSTSMSWWWPTRQMDLIELGIMPSIHLATDQAWAVI